MNSEFFPRFERLLKKFSDVCLQGFAPAQRDKVLDDLVERWKHERPIRRPSQSASDFQAQQAISTQGQQVRDVVTKGTVNAARGNKRPIPVLTETPWPSVGHFIYSEPSLKRMKMSWDLTDEESLNKDDPSHHTQSDLTSTRSFPGPSITNASTDGPHPITGHEEENGSTDSTLPDVNQPHRSSPALAGGSPTPYHHLEQETSGNSTSNSVQVRTTPKTPIEFMRLMVQGEVSKAFKEMKLREKRRPLLVNITNLVEISSHVSRMHEPGMTADQVLNSPLPEVQFELTAPAWKGVGKEVQESDIEEEHQKMLIRLNSAILGQHLMCYISKTSGFKPDLVEDEAVLWRNAVSHILDNCPDNGPSRQLKEHNLQFHQVLCWGRAVARYPWLPIYASDLYALIFEKPYLKMQPLLVDYIVENAAKTPRPSPELGLGFFVPHIVEKETQTG